MEKKLNKVLKRSLTIGLPLILAAYIFSGCASSSGKEAVEPGTLTITGIPEEFNGKFALAPIWSIPDYTRAIQSSSRVAVGESTAISNGEANMSVYVPRAFGKPNGYAGNDIRDVRVNINDAPVELQSDAGILHAIFQEVQFENGVAKVNWEDRIQPGLITVNNIPDGYNVNYETRPAVTGKAEIRVGQTRAVANMIPPEIPNGSGTVRNGTVTVAVLRNRNASGYESYDESTANDILLLLEAPSQTVGTSGAVSVAQYHQFLFSKVQVIDGKATLDFRQAARQQ